MTKISLILPLYNSEKFIDECLDSINSQSFKDFELIVIDDCSKDNTRKILDKYGYKYHAHKTNLGFTKTANEGIKMAKGEYIMIIDHDLILEKDYISKMLKENKDITCSRVYYYKQKDKIRGLNIKINLLTGKTTIVGRDEIDKGQLDKVKNIEAMGAACLLIKRTVFDKVGLFDANFTHFFADTDFCFRLRKKGYKIFPTSAKSWHKKDEKEVMNPVQKQRYYHDKTLFLKKNSPYYPIPLIPMYLKKWMSRINTSST
jgi:GT2 family glycosyltransferase